MATSKGYTFRKADILRMLAAKRAEAGKRLKKDTADELKRQIKQEYQNIRYNESAIKGNHKRIALLKKGGLDDWNKRRLTDDSAKYDKMITLLKLDTNTTVEISANGHLRDLLGL